MFNNDNHPDRFAGQYPAPPSLLDQNNTPTPPSLHQEVYIPPPPIPASHDYYHQPPQEPSYYPQHAYDYNEPIPPQHYYTPPQHQATPVVEQPLEDYLRQEREEYMKHEEEQVPMVQKESDEPLSRKERKQLEKFKQQHQGYQPYLTKPTLAPYNEADSYKINNYNKKDDTPCCCCYNPAITCCSFFCLLISVAFCAAGIAMIIASKVVSDKCTNECGSVIDQAQGACNTICSKVLHDGMFYGGIVVAALATIAIIWKIIMWTCAGYSRR